MRKDKDGFLICEIATKNCKDKGVDKEVICCTMRCIDCQKYREEDCKGCKNNMEYHSIKQELLK